MQTRKRRNKQLVPLLIILGLMVFMVLYTTRVIQDVAVSNIQEVGEDKISSVAAQLDNYLERTRSALWVTADTVDFMLRSGSTTAQIEDYIVEETTKQARQFDDNYTGFYGFIKGEYLDGLHWQPPEGYDPVQRDWYKLGVLSGGEATIVPPYVDAQTHDVVISICRQLSDSRDVMALDVKMNRIQEMMAALQIKEKGYGFIVDDTGMIIAHQDEDLKGGNIGQTDEQSRFLEGILRTRNGSFETTLDGQRHTVFVNSLLDKWYVVIAIGNRELYAEVWQQLVVNILICVIIFILIALFYYLGYRNEQSYSRQMEALKIEEQQQAYEAQVFKLAKEAADQANKAKSDFLAEMSHEIRTPINAVLGMNEMIMREIREAISAGKAALSTAERVLNSLGSADSWATWDLFGGGLISDLAKHSHLDEAQGMVEHLQVQLRRFKTELADVTIHADLQVSIDGFLRFADYFFDGLFADWAVKDQIYQSQRRVEQTASQIESVLHRLNSMLANAEQEQKRAREELDALVLAH